MHSFRARREYLSLPDEAFDEILERSQPRACIIALVGIELFGPAAALLLAIPWIVELPGVARVAVALPLTAFLYFGPRWLGRWLEPLRIAKRQSAMLRHIDRQHARAD